MADDDTPDSGNPQNVVAQWLIKLGLAKPDAPQPQGLGQAGAPPPGAMSPNMMGPPQQMQPPQGLGQQGAPPPGPPPMTQNQQGMMQQVPGYGAVQGGLDRNAPGGPSINMKGLAGPQPANFVPTGTPGAPNINAGQSGPPPKGPLDKAANGPPPPPLPPPITGQQAFAIAQKFRIPPDKAAELLEKFQKGDYENKIKQYNAFIRQEGVENARQKAIGAKTPGEAAHWMHMANSWIRMADKAGTEEVPTGEKEPTWGPFGLLGGGDKKEPARAKYDRKAKEALDKSEKVMSGVENDQTGGDVGEEPAAAPETPTVGAVMKGYRFKGGDPSDQKNWVKVGG